MTFQCSYACCRQSYHKLEEGCCSWFLSIQPLENAVITNSLCVAFSWAWSVNRWHRNELDHVAMTSYESTCEKSKRAHFEIIWWGRPQTSNLTSSHWVGVAISILHSFNFTAGWDRLFLFPSFFVYSLSFFSAPTLSRSKHDAPPPSCC